jgi:hypothetical protein
MSAGILANFMISSATYIIQAALKNLIILSLNYIPFLSVTRKIQLKDFRWCSFSYNWRINPTN